MMQQITISPRFFKKEKENHSDWALGFWREFFQNSIDAGASKIDIEIDESGEWITFTDNGTGFSADVRDNIYFKLGETNKSGNSIGGFGKARILTCFSHKQYEIWSQDWYCIGSGASYDVSSSDYFSGCRVRVHLDISSPNSSTVDMRSKLFSYLRCSQLDCVVNINGVKWADWGYKRRLAKRLSFGNVYVNKSGGFQHRLFVRVSGVLMFESYLNPSMQVVVEIDPSMSRSVLLSNRDSLSSGYQSELSQFIQILAVDTKSALRSNTRKISIFQGNPCVTKGKKKIIKSIMQDVGRWKKAIAALMKDDPPQSKSTVDETFEHNTMSDLSDEYIPSAIMVCESEDRIIRRVSSKYSPSSWSLDKQNGGNRRKLLRQWVVVINAAIKEWIKITDAEDKAWRPGFVFSDYCVAQQMTDSTNVSCFLLNPVDEKGKMRYKLRNKDDWNELIVNACHEVTHLSYTYHDEDFSTLFGTLVRKVMCKRNKIFKVLLGTLKKDK